ncbi:MAG: 6-carboxytetrahydropterin synthase [Candidatus Marinimicrobia bacterium]|jgi:6-pyruvoyltetrahydropterin/6-carboxytetrahydropterin synthase|nr:6-carboxytetrahydropterin synthase [Candidatus Neomarinimicrobiota bacterium]MBT3676729.1 6-carboxytetrahydropterin synthase [Candidatus Neomarinimicrobiota bacterium]MBT3764168.1 6-carboxytetrahydropterin synthase [Candidatus Neomarinimicrobiota bacterium]MBT4068522.1 6-carboxytetrahydropterin synthase [Candidatus Neomarinimicrobiota bacterium]MBT4271435.1 6-carboxytetrahydropterin synthase [Candidatus Neomarinimicrobiota bacterium]
MNNPYLTKVFYFNAAHQYGHGDWTDEKNWDVFGPDSKVHGHNYTLEVMVTGEINPETGFIVDLGHLKKIVETHVIDILDHSQIEKEVDWFKDKQPSSENLVQFIWEQIAPRLKGAKLHRIRLRETPTIFTDYYGPSSAS